MSTEIRLGFGHRHQDSLSITTATPDELKQRFRDVKQDLNDRSDAEVMNDQVLSVLLDLYWLHHEDPLGPD